MAEKRSATIDLNSNVFSWAGPGAEPYLAWRYDDPVAGRTRLLLAEFFGPLPTAERQANLYH
ncbi:MAG: hypothetical protein EXS36_11755 [Pedosphaera sp.]|nr:hypothetical protein [Pedosphaera sp.]